MAKSKKESKTISSTAGKGIVRGSNMVENIILTETAEEVIQLVRWWNHFTVRNQPTATDKPEDIERAVRNRMLDFGMTDLPTSRNLQDWQEWLNRQGKTNDTDNSGGKVEADKPNKTKRKTKSEKIALIAAHLKEQPYATSPDIEKATSIDESDIRKLWKPIKRSLREGKRGKPTGSKNKGKLEAEDRSASCKICANPLSETFHCDLCGERIIGECKTCHSTNTHPDDAIP